MKNCILVVAVLLMVLGNSQPIYHDPAYKQNEAALGVFYSTVSYYQKFSVQQWTCDLCLNGKYRDKKLTQIKSYYVGAQPEYQIVVGYVGYYSSGRMLTIVFKGRDGVYQSTKNDENTVPPLDQTMIDYQIQTCPGCKVNEELYNDYLKFQNLGMINDIMTNITQYPKPTVFITGHGTGGAYAQLLAFKLKKLFIQNRLMNEIKVYTYGSFSVGNKNFADQYYLKVPYTVRVVYQLDSVPHVLNPTNQPSGYIQVGEEAWINKQNQLQICLYNPSIIAKCSSTIPPPQLNPIYNDYHLYFDYYDNLSIVSNNEEASSEESQSSEL